MRGRCRARTRALAAMTVAATGILGAGPAHAECLEVTFEVQWWDRPPSYPLGAQDKCVTDTPWAQTDETHSGHQEHTPIAPTAPRGYWLQIWVPLP
jgi:hypothetical protein